MKRRNEFEVEFLGSLQPNPTGGYAGQCKYMGTVFSYHLTLKSECGVPYIRGTISVIDPKTGRVKKLAGSALREYKKGRENRGHEKESAKTPTMSTSIHIQNLDAIEDRIKDSVSKLYASHAIDLLDSVKQCAYANDIEFPLLIALYEHDFLSNCRLSKSTHDSYRRRLNRLATLLPISVSSMTEQDIKRASKELGNQWAEVAMTASKFLDFVYMKKKSPSPINPFSNSVSTTSSRGGSTNLPLESLSTDDEAILNQKIVEMADPGPHLGIILIKDGGHSTKDVCAFTWSAIQWSAESTDEAWVLHRRDDIAGATHIYTAPLFPYAGKLFISRYQKLLDMGYTPQRLAKMPVISQRDNPEKGLSTADLTTLCRHELSLCHPNADKGVTITGRSVSVLQNTYARKLRDICKLDDGAIQFMLHRVLNSVQSSYYRAFIDGSAREFLVTALHRDRRFSDKKIRGKREQVQRSVVGGVHKFSVLPPTDCHVVDVSFDLELYPDELFEIISKHGCSVVIEQLVA